MLINRDEIVHKVNSGKIIKNVPNFYRKLSVKG